jgi:hypothetical protein
LISDNDQSAIEDEFSKSWELMEMFYGEHLSASRVELKKKMLFFIAEMRERGYDRSLRAGQQLLDFILSRSRLPGLRAGQASLRFSLQFDGSMTIQYKGSDGNSTLNLVDAEFTPELESLLKRLVAHPID